MNRLLRLIVIFLTLIFILPSIINLSNYQEHFSLPLDHLVWIQGKGDEFLEKGLVWQRPTVRPNNLPVQRTPCPDKHHLPCSTRGNCKSVYGEDIYKKCQDNGGSYIDCNCCDYCYCVANGGKLAKCKINKNYRDCLVVNRAMGKGAIQACQMV